MRPVRRPARAAVLRGRAMVAALLGALAVALPGPAVAAPAASHASGAVRSDADTAPAGAAGTGRRVLHRVDVSGAPGMEMVTSLVELQPGERLPRHIHHGVETAYVLQGATIQAPRQAPRTLAAGSTAVHLRGVPHGGFTVVGDTALKLLTTHVVDKGKPLVDAAPPEGRPEALRADPPPDTPR